jgi:hypothetical protein
MDFKDKHYFEEPCKLRLDSFKINSIAIREKLIII